MLPTRKEYVVYTTVMCSIAMAIIDGVVQPPYAVKSAIKFALFFLLPMGYFALFRAWGQLKSLFVPRKRDLLIALVLGFGAFGVIIGGYALISRFFDLDTAILQLTSDGGVGPENFVYVSTYIALVNSMLEEFFFRGFAFISMKKLSSRGFAYVFSGALFAIYHFGMVAGGGNPLIWIGAMAGLFAAGLILNALNEKSGSIVTSWLLHMCANLAINAVGFYVFGML